MTTIKDYARDLVLEAIKKISEKNPDLDMLDLTEDEIEDLVEEFIETLKNRIVGE